MRHLTPESTIITFDLHGVLFTTDYRTFLRIMWDCKHLTTLLSHACRPSIWYACAQLWYKTSPIERYIMDLTAQWPALAICKNDLICLANAQKPNHDMFALVTTLKNEGYELHIFSNIGTVIFTDLAQQFPELITIFDHIFTTSPTIGYPSKKEPSFYSHYLQSKDSLKSKKVVFIDNSLKNVRLGNKLGMISLYFKSFDQIKQQLRKLKILPK